MDREDAGGAGVAALTTPSAATSASVTGRCPTPSVRFGDVTMPSLRLLHVEDDPMDVRLFGMMLRELAVPDDAVRRVPTLRDALDALADDGIDLVFLDLDLPDSRGLDTAERLLAARTDVPVVVLTGNRDEELGVRAVALGAQDFLVKDTIHAAVLGRVLRYALVRQRVVTLRVRDRAREAAADAWRRASAEARAALEHEIDVHVNDTQVLRHRLGIATGELEDAYDGAVEGWARALDLRDHETMGHSRRVADMAVALGIRLGLPPDEIGHLRRGALLHDIGKIAVPDAILTKHGALDPQERALMEQHAAYARDLLEPIGFLRDAMDVPYAHHERWDGSGYPRRLKGEEIPLAARIFAVVDVYDALTSDRPYRSAWSEREAREYLARAAGRLFDPAVVDAFLGLPHHAEPE
jgi:response regulator RpfG family c-di-GMP phosphodiesterase